MCRRRVYRMLSGYIAMVLCCALLVSCKEKEHYLTSMLALPLRAELVINTGEIEYRVTVRLDGEDRGEEDAFRTGEVIYLSPRGVKGIRAVRDGTGSHLEMESMVVDIDANTEENQLFLPFSLFNGGEIVNKEINGGQVIYRLSDGREIYVHTQDDRITGIRIGDLVCRVEWIEIGER